MKKKIKDSAFHVFGSPIARSELIMRSKFTGEYLKGYSEKIRDTMDSLSGFTYQHLEEITIDALTNEDSIIAGRSAWYVVGWNEVFHPFGQDSDIYFYPRERLIEKIKGDPASLQMYGTYVLKEPSEEIYKRLKSQHPDAARQYMHHCRSLYVISQNEPTIKDIIMTW